MTWYILILSVWNAAVFLLYGADKYKAKRGGRRISEKSLIISAFAMGSIGALLGMGLFRHKTRHMKFRLLLPLALVANAAVIWGAAAKGFL